MKTLNIESVVCKHFDFFSRIFSAISPPKFSSNRWTNRKSTRGGGVKFTRLFKNKLEISWGVGFHVLFVSRGDFSFNFH